MRHAAAPAARGMAGAERDPVAARRAAHREAGGLDHRAVPGRVRDPPLHALAAAEPRGRAPGASSVRRVSICSADRN